MFPGLNVSDIEAVQSRQIDLHAMAHHQSIGPVVTARRPSGPPRIDRLARMLTGMLAFLHLRHAPTPVA